MDQQSKEANKPVQTPKASQNETIQTQPALQIDTDKYNMPPAWKRNLKLTEEETKFFNNHGYCVKKSTSRDWIKWKKNDKWK